jgi:flagellar biosynthesis/type III secretory pathway chaperone
MMPADPHVDPLLDALVKLLDAEIQQMRTQSEQIQGLGEAIARRDETALGALLARVEGEQSRQQALEEQTGRIRAALAKHYGLDIEEARLGVLLERVPPRWRGPLGERRQGIIDMAESLRRQNYEAAVMLYECTRVNRRLLECLTCGENSVDTYDSEGSSRRRYASGTLNAEL